MKILAVSDVIVDNLYAPGLRRWVGDVDCVVSCGDLPLYYLDFLTSVLNVPLFYVFGNHDAGFEYKSSGEIERGVPGGLNLDESARTHGGLLLAGLAGSRRYRPRAVHQYTEGDMWLKALRLMPSLLLNRARRGRFLDILVTHAPPFGIHDGPDEPHVGFKTFRGLMRGCRPRYLLHGHKHVYTPGQQTETRFEDTTVINVYPFRVLDIEVPHG